MDVLLQISLIVFPAGMVLLTSIYFIRKETEKEARSLQVELKKQRQKYFLPTRLDAYQRLVLLLERIEPGSLVMRMHNPIVSAATLQAEFLRTIREEFEHNVAQQLFVSQEAWKLVKIAKEETIKIINLAGSYLQENSTGMDLSTKIFEIVAEIGKLPTEVAIEYLKKEMQELF